MKVPAVAEHLALLRTVVHYYAGRADLTLDQIDDLKMAVDEAAVHLLKHTSGSTITLDMSKGEGALELRVSTDIDHPPPVIDETSFSWQILRALADDLGIDADNGRASLVLRKRYADLGTEDAV